MAKILIKAGFMMVVITLIWTIPVRAESILEYVTPTPNSSPADLAFDAQGSLWFTEIHGNKIGKLLPSEAEPGTSKGITEYDLPNPKSKPQYIHISKDGMVWFSEWGVNSIGRLDPKTGVIKEFPIPTPKSEPHNLTEDEDGNIWFLEFETNKVGMLNPASGTIKEFQVNEGHPHDLVLTGGGQVWYTQGGKFWMGRHANKIGRLDITSGKVEEILIPPKTSTPHSMTKGVDGSIWFTQFKTKKLSRLDFSKGSPPAVVDYPLSKESKTAHDLVVDDKNHLVWFVDNHADTVGHLDLKKSKPNTSNGIKIFKIPTRKAHPHAIALDSAGNVWFTEMGLYFRGQFQNKIGKLVP